MKKLKNALIYFIVFALTIQIFSSQAYAVTNPGSTSTDKNIIAVQMYNQTISNQTNSINPCYKITNTGTTTINLADIKLRYYYTNEIQEKQNFYCDWSSVGASNITGKFVRMDTPLTTADYYLEISFTSTAGSLVPGKSVELKTRFSKSDWSSYTQAGDYSFNETATNYQDWTKTTAYIKDTLAWGNECNGVPVSTASSVKLQMFNASRNATDTTIYPRYKLTNSGKSDINLSDVKIRYYFTIDDEKPMNFFCDWSNIGASNITGKFTKVPEPQTNADYYFDLGFTNSVSKLYPGQTVEIQSRIAKSDWSKLNQLNDYSFNSTANNYVDWDKVAVYIGDNLIYGKALDSTKDIDKDTDKDGLPDTYESDVLIPTMINKGISLHNPSSDEDYDEDGLTNLQEYKLGTNPSSSDTDNDGVSDYDEVNIYHTDPCNSDTDGDGLLDGTEISCGLNPQKKDTDDNGIIDSQETNEQVLLPYKYDNIDKQNNGTIPEITVQGKGDFNKQLEIKDLSKNTTFKAVNSIIGHPIEVKHDSSLKFDSAKVKFKLSSDVLTKNNIDDLAVAWYDESSNKLVPLKTTINKSDNSIYANVDHFSDYVVVNMKTLTYDWDVDNTSSTVSSGKADVVFVIDTTGSMSGTINNVKNYISEYVDKLQKAKVDIRLGLVEFRDITVDGKYSTKDHGWFNEVSSFKTEVNTLTAGGGGDLPESDVDGLENARLKDYRQNVNKYIVLVTDASYKEETSYPGLGSMQEEVNRLKSDNICTSVVSSTSYQDIYSNLYNGTNGIFANIYSDFSTALEPLIVKMSGEVNSGTWVRLSNGSIVKLDKDPHLGDYSVDSDKDGIPDLVELGKEVTVDLSEYGIASKQGSMDYWTFNSNPAEEDTDGDGIKDKFDSKPNNFDVRVEEKTDSTITLNTGKTWTKFGVDIYRFMDEAMYFVDLKLDGDPVVPWDQVGDYCNKLDSNDKLNLSPEELSVIYLADTNGVRYYLNSRGSELRNSTYKCLTGQDVKYYKHSFSGWEETSDTESKWYDLFSQVYSQADVSLVICRKLDAVDFIQDTLPKIVFAGVVIGGGFLALPEIDAITEAASIFGVGSTIKLYLYGGSSLLNTMSENPEVAEAETNTPAYLGELEKKPQVVINKEVGTAFENYVEGTKLVNVDYDIQDLYGIVDRETGNLVQVQPDFTIKSLTTGDKVAFADAKTALTGTIPFSDQFKRLVWLTEQETTTKTLIYYVPASGDYISDEMINFANMYGVRILQVVAD